MTATVKSMPSPVRNHPSRTVPSAHSTRAFRQNDGRARPSQTAGNHPARQTGSDRLRSRLMWHGDVPLCDTD